MSYQTLAQAGALKAPATNRPHQQYTLRYKVAWRWRFIRCWGRYFVLGLPHSAPGMFDFVSNNRFFRALQVESELAALSEVLAQLRPDRALEIGTAGGGTLLLLAGLASPEATIVSVDLPGGRFGGGYDSRRGQSYQRFARRKQRLHLLRGDSHSIEMLDRAKAAVGGQELDYLFIDGDHTYEGVKKDFEMYGPLVRKGGLVAFHDIAEHPPEVGCEVSWFWDEIKESYRHEEIIENRMQGWAGIGVLYVD